MNYQRIYEQLTAKDMIADYTEKHHIIPRCMGGTNHKSNLVKLTPEAHYVAHQLLVKIYPDNYKLIFAVHMMNKGRSTNKLYGWLRRKHAAEMSKLHKGKVSPTKGVPMSAELKAKLSAIAKLRPPATAETRAKISEANKGKVSPNKGIPLSEETKAKLSASKKGKPKSVEHNAKNSAARKGQIQPKLQCPHCNKNVDVGNYNRWHGDKCKHK